MGWGYHLNQTEKENLEYYLSRNYDWHVVEGLSATEYLEISACALMN